MDLKFEIPRNVKATRSFMRLNVKGWVCMVSVPSFLGGASWLLFQNPYVSMGAVVLSGVLSYLSFEIDEKTGEPNIKLAMNVFQQFASKRKLTPKWGGNEHDETKKAFFIDVKTER